MAGYHQFHAVNKAVSSTLQAASPKGDRRVGVVWHTRQRQESDDGFLRGEDYPACSDVESDAGRSSQTATILMTSYSGHSLAARNYCASSQCRPKTANHLKQLLQVSSGGVVVHDHSEVPARKERYTVPAAFRPTQYCSDEGHRSQYEFINGFARNLRNALPHASFIGFTATPLEVGDGSTPAIFDDYIDVNDIQRAVEDGATIRIFYEGRLAKLQLKADEPF